MSSSSSPFAGLSSSPFIVPSPAKPCPSRRPSSAWQRLAHTQSTKPSGSLSGLVPSATGDSATLILSNGLAALVRGQRPAAVATTAADRSSVVAPASAPPSDASSSPDDDIDVEHEYPRLHPPLHPDRCRWAASHGLNRPALQPHLDDDDVPPALSGRTRSNGAEEITFWSVSCEASSGMSQRPGRAKYDDFDDDAAVAGAGGGHDGVAHKVEEMDDEENDSETVKMMSESPGPSTPGATPGPPLFPPAGRASPSTAAVAGPSAPPAKRPRGRPRKHPLPSPDVQAKLARGRSKTGCITCRRRKKKCDETRPACLNCQKNAVVCEGYPDRVVWKSGRQKAEEERMARKDMPPKELPVLVDGIEEETDQYLLSHFSQRLSKLLTLYNDDKNPFRKILLPMAVRHKGLMHSLLCLSGSHMVAENQPMFADRQEYHFREACRVLREDRRLDAHARGHGALELVDDPTVASTLVLCLNSICKGETQGQYRPHMDAAKVLVINQQSRTSPFSEFLIEFFSYHDTVNGITSLDRRPIQLTEDFQLPEFIVQPEAGSMLGVLDGLFGYISKITKLRDTIRRRMRDGQDNAVDYEMVSEAIILDRGIRTWMSAQKEGSARYIASLLYRQCTWIYLYRTIQPSRPSEKIKEAVDEGLNFLRQLAPEASTQSILLMPLFLLGCAAFYAEQRPEIRRAFGTLKRYSSLGNIEVARKVVERVWAMMDAGDEKSWDWESIISSMGYDFLCT